MTPDEKRIVESVRCPGCRAEPNQPCLESYPINQLESGWRAREPHYIRAEYELKYRKQRRRIDALSARLPDHRKDKL